MIVVLHKCSRCPRWLPRDEQHFQPGSDGERRYLLLHCRDCGRAARRATRAKNPGIYRETEARWRERHRDKHLTRATRYNHSEAGRKRRKRGERKAKILLHAPIPVPVIQPYVQRAAYELAYSLNHEGAYTMDGFIDTQRARGTEQLAEATDVSARRIHAILHYEAQVVSLENVDKLCVVIGVTVAELVQRALEWAQLTGDSWPYGYKLEGRMMVKCSGCQHGFELKGAQRQAYAQGEFVYCSRACQTIRLRTLAQAA